MNRSDDNWALARSIRRTPSREGLKPGCQGLVAAERHPTGWFISAQFDPDLPPEQIDDFAHFVVVRTFLLLEYGPRPPVWVIDVVGVWHAHCRSVTPEFVNLPLIV